MKIQKPPGFDPFRKNDPFRRDPKKPLLNKQRSKILLILGIVAFVAFEIPLQLEARKFYYRFADAIAANQQQVFEVSREEFTPQFNELISLYHHSTETAPIMKQMEVIQQTSDRLGELLQAAEARFPYQDFAEERHESIRRFFVVLHELDRERHRHVLETNECIRMKLLRLNGAEDVCAEEDIRWSKNSRQLQERLYGSLQLPPKEEEKFKQLYLVAMHRE